MAILKERMHRKNASGTYDVIHLETEAGIVLRSDGTTVEDALSNPQPISTGGTNASTGAEALYNLISACETVSDTSTISDSDMLGILDTSSQTAKKISLKKLLNLSGGGSEPEEPVTNPNWPNKSDLTLGNTISWANQQWIVSHVTSTKAYLTLKSLPKGLSGSSNWNGLQRSCTTFANKFTEDQKACLKRVTAGNTSGIVFVATHDQMDGGFRYFGHYSRNSLGEWYWTSTDNPTGNGAWAVNSDGNLSIYSTVTSALGFRPSVCIDLTLYNQ